VILICLKQAGLLGSVLKGWKLPHQNTEIHFYPHRQHGLEEFFSQENVMMFWSDVCAVVESLGHQHNPT